LPDFCNVKKDAVVILRHTEDSKRRVTQVSAGCEIPGACLPHPDPKDQLTAVRGVQKRFLALVPESKPEVMRDFALFVKLWLSENLTPLPSDSDVSFDTWINNTNYPEWRREELRNVFRNMNGLESKDLKCKSFIKRETYLNYKHARGINSRTDAFKVFCGPIFTLIEKSVFKMKWFIKKIPIDERPRYIKDMFAELPGYTVSTDFETFEALFVPELMSACEMQLYEHMSQFIDGGNEWYKTIFRVLTGLNICDFRSFVTKVFGTRMSGEMCTSLGNSFTNLMVFLFVCKRMGIPDPPGVVEGDDGAFRVERIPTSSMFEDLGLKIKIESHESFEEMSFCGMVFDSEDLLNVSDPREYLASFSWLSNRYACAKRNKLLALLRCKALSLAYQYIGCPIISELAQYGLRMTRGIDIRHVVKNSPAFDSWERDKLLAALKDEKRLREKLKPIPVNTRLLVAKLYGLSIELQMDIERYLRAKSTLSPICSPSITLLMDADWCHYASNYTSCNLLTHIDLLGDRPGARILFSST